MRLVLEVYRITVHSSELVYKLSPSRKRSRVVNQDVASSRVNQAASKARTLFVDKVVEHLARIKKKLASIAPTDLGGLSFSRPAEAHGPHDGGQHPQGTQDDR